MEGSFSCQIYEFLGKERGARQKTDCETRPEANRKNNRFYAGNRAY